MKAALILSFNFALIVAASYEIEMDVGRYPPFPRDVSDVLHGLIVLVIIQSAYTFAIEWFKYIAFLSSFIMLLTCFWSIYLHFVDAMNSNIGMLEMGYIGLYIVIGVLIYSIFCLCIGLRAIFKNVI